MNQLMRNVRTAHIFIILIFTCGLCHGEIYKWVDENGKVHYSQIPLSQDAEKVKVREYPETSSSNSSSSGKGLSSIESQKKYSDYLEQERLERKEKREQKKQKKAELRSKCHQVRAELNDMNQGGVTYYELDEDGNRVFVGDKRIEARINKLQGHLEKECRSI